MTPVPMPTLRVAILALAVLATPILAAGAQAASAGQFPPAVVTCLTKVLGAGKAAELDAGSRRPTAAEQTAIGRCFSESAGPSSGPPSPGGPPASSGGSAKPPSSRGTKGCPSLDSLIANVVGPPEARDYRAPSAADIACNAKKAKRLPLRTGAFTVLDPDLQDRSDYGSWGRAQGGVRTLLKLRDGLRTAGFPAALSPQAQNGLPPFTVPHPIPLASLGEVARAYSAVLLKEKAAARRVLFNVPESPGASWPATATAYEAWLKEYWVPRVALLAKAAETVKAEYFDPFTPEADVFFNTNGLRSLPGSERLALAQELVDATRRAAAPFKGVLVGRQGWQFEAPTASRDFWAAAPMGDLSFKGYGLLGVTLLPVVFGSCTPDYAHAYLQKQLAQVTKMAARDVIPWAVLELDVFTFGSLKQHAACGADPQAAYSAIWQAVLDELRAVSPAPRLIAFTYPSEWSGQAAILAELKKLFAAYKR